MCLTKKYKWPRITLRPKIVYKVLKRENKKLFTPFRGSLVELGKEYKGIYHRNDTLLSTIFDEFVNSGFIHSYKDKETAINHLALGDIIVECTIPRFTLYFIGYDDIASRKIYYKNIVKIKEIKSNHFIV